MMAQSVAERTVEQISETSRQASRATGAIGEAIESGVGVARRAARHGGDAAEEFLNDTMQRLQRHIVLTVVATFAAGLSSGALIAWLAKRR
jgi:hypothetical protein